MRNDPTIVDYDFVMDGMVVTLIDPWFINAYGTSFIGGTAQEVIDAAGDYVLRDVVLEPIRFSTFSALR
jgi:hypothetical protein